MSLAAVDELGGGATGYRRTLAAGAVGACFQILFALLGAARLVAVVPSAAVEGMLAAIGSGSFHRFVEDFYDGYQRELDAVRHPELLSVFRRAASYSITSTLDGPIDTMQFWASDWSELFADIEVPLSLIYGTHDANMPRALVEAVSARLGLRRASFIENAGSFLLMDSPEAVARLLSER